MTKVKKDGQMVAQYPRDSLGQSKGSLRHAINMTFCYECVSHFFYAFVSGLHAKLNKQRNVNVVTYCSTYFPL